MHSGFKKGLIIGGVLGAAASMFANNQGMMGHRSRRKLMKSGRNIVRKSGIIIEDIVDLFR